MTDEELQAIRELAENATNSEWFWDSYSQILAEVPVGHPLDCCPKDGVNINGKKLAIICYIDGGLAQKGYGDELVENEARSNALFIQEARKGVPALLNEVDRLQAENLALAEQKEALASELEHLGRRAGEELGADLCEMAKQWVAAEISLHRWKQDFAELERQHTETTRLCIDVVAQRNAAEAEVARLEVTVLELSEQKEALASEREQLRIRAERTECLLRSWCPSCIVAPAREEK